MRRIAAVVLFLAACGQPDSVVAPDPAPTPASSAEERIVKTAEPDPEPTAAVEPEAASHRAVVILVPLRSFPNDLLDEIEETLERVLGLTEVDISTTKGKFKDWGVFGLGYAPGQSAVVSSFRLERKAERDKVRFRVANTALHEVGHTFGHTFGLQHCEEARCPMPQRVVRELLRGRQLLGLLRGLVGATRRCKRTRQPLESHASRESHDARSPSSR